MALSFNYSILSAIPDRSRGERVNIGVIVFLNDRVDVRIAEVSKLRALTGTDWTEYTNKFAALLESRFQDGESALKEIEAFPKLDPAFQASEIGAFRVENLSQYEGRITEIMTALVLRPKEHLKHDKTPRINTEISSHFKRIHVLAKTDDPIESHKVFQNYQVEDELKADFVQKNGVMRFAATIDLRKAKPQLREAALKAVILDRAKEITGECTCIGIYASLRPDAQEVKQHIQLLREYSDETYNWSDEIDRKKLTDFVLDGMSAKGALI
jgi:hypothetical protein